MMADVLNVPMNISVSPIHLDSENSNGSTGFMNGTGDFQEVIKDTFVKPEIHVEILQQNSSTLSSENLILLAHRALKNEKLSYEMEDIVFSDFNDPEIAKHVKDISLNVSDPDRDKDVSVKDLQLKYYTFRLNSCAEDTECIEEGVPATTQWVLPAAEFHGAWENLVYDTDVKSELLKFVSKSLAFAEKKVNDKVISWNKVVLLHGPPGTGKTSLCRALAQKLSIRLSDKYKNGQLIEINSHSLFSKWFSESGKLVMKMFEKIRECIEEPGALVFVLIDEVESLAHSRMASLGGADPSDSVRVVNALLTQLDQIRRYPNVVILTTSNITEAIDLALVDRADITHYIGLPSVSAIYEIYSSCIRELQHVGFVYTKEPILPLRMLSVAQNHGSEIMRCCCLMLKEIAEQSQGLSGRTLRKLPYIAFSSDIKASTTLRGFLIALSRAVDRKLRETEKLQTEKNVKKMCH